MTTALYCAILRHLHVARALTAPTLADLAWLRAENDALLFLASA